MRVALIFLIFLLSCREDTKKDKPFFDVDSLLDQQIQHLNKSRAALDKLAYVDNQRDSSRMIPDSIGWVHEFEIFRQLDQINKPIFADTYEFSDGTEDSRSNLTLRRYTAKGEAPVRDLLLYYQGSIQHLKKMEGVMEESNTLYFSTRTLTIELDEMNGRPAITAYTVRGTQKMIMSDSVRFSISSKVSYPD
jgi:hypothetical protein